MRDAVKRELGVDSAVPATYPVGRIVGWTTLAAAVPGVVLLALPPLLTAVTALVVMFPAHRWLRSTVDAERQTMPQRGGEFAAGADLEAVAEDSSTISHDPSALRIEPNETNSCLLYTSPSPRD